MFIGDRAKLVRDAFALAKEKAPAIMFIDELDAIGTKRFNSEKSGDREVERTMLELLNQLDRFSSDNLARTWSAIRNTDNGGMLKAVCVEAGTIALRSGGTMSISWMGFWRFR